MPKFVILQWVGDGLGMRTKEIFADSYDQAFNDHVAMNPPGWTTIIEPYEYFQRRTEHRAIQDEYMAEFLRVNGFPVKIRPQSGLFKIDDLFMVSIEEMANMRDRLRRVTSVKIVPRNENPNYGREDWRDCSYFNGMSKEEVFDTLFAAEEEGTLANFLNSRTTGYVVDGKVMSFALIKDLDLVS